MTATLSQTWTIIQHPLMLPIEVCVLAGFLAYVAARRFKRFSAAVSLIASLVTLVLTIRLFTGQKMAIDISWLAIDGFELAVAMSNRTFGAMIAMVAACFGLLVSLYALSNEKDKRDEGRFHAFLCWALAGTVGVALADDLIWLLLCWELVSVCLYMLLNQQGGESPAGAAKSFVMLGFADACLLLAVAFLAATQGTTRIAELAIPIGSSTSYVCYLLFVIAALAKAGAFPLHSWIPAAASDASASTFAFLPASIDKLLGTYLLVRVSFGVFELDHVMQIVLMVIGAVTVLSASMAALVQTNLKRSIAYLAISSTGYIVLAVGAGTPIALAGAIFHAVNGAIYQACLFFGAGNVEHVTGTSRLDRLGALGHALPGTMLCFIIAALAISGVPPLNGFVSKWLIYQGCLATGSSLAIFCLVVMVFGSALALAASFKLIASIFFGTSPVDLRSDQMPANGSWATMVPMIVLAATCIAFGVVAVWPLQHLILPVLADAEITGTNVAMAGNVIEAGDLGLWAPAPATILILLGMFGGIMFYLIGHVGRTRVTKTFLGGETTFGDTSKPHLSPTDYYRTVEDMPCVGQVLKDGQTGAFDVYRLGGRYGLVFVETLRRLHTGVLSLYASWCLVGVVVICIYLMAVL